MNPLESKVQISRRSALTLLGAAIVATPAAARSPASNITVIWPWVRASWKRETMGFLTILNENPFDDELIHINSPWADKCSLRTMEWHGYEMNVREVDRFPVPPFSRTDLKPGGTWIQIRLARAAVNGESMPLTLRFARAGRVEVQAQITNRMLGPLKDFPSY